MTSGTGPVGLGEERSPVGEAGDDAGGWLLRRAGVAPGIERDLSLFGGRLVSPDALGADPRVVDLEGRPVLAGLVDQHLHLAALAAAGTSVDLSPEALRRAGGLGPALRRARTAQPHGWLRAVGYDVATSGALDRRVLDAVGVGPVRVQDRTGTCWVLDQRGLAEVLPQDGSAWPEGVEVDAAGRPSGRLFRLDGWLGERVGSVEPDLGSLARWLAQRGVTTVVDASATNGPAAVERLAAAGLPQRIVVMTADPRTGPVGDVRVGPVKILLDDAALPSLDDLTRRVTVAHASGRGVAVHCVTTVQLVLALAAGLRPGDRIEHGSVIPDDVLPLVAGAGVIVVTQPGLVRTRGDRYLHEVEADERAVLYRLASLRRAGIPVAMGTDAPYGPADPWVHVAAALDRRTAQGVVVGVDEAVDFDTALGLLQRDPLAPAGPRVAVGLGAAGDLCVLDTDWGAAAADPAAVAVHSTWIRGRPVHGPPADAIS